MLKTTVHLSNIQLQEMADQIAKDDLDIDYSGMISFNAKLGRAAGIYHPLNESITIDPKIQKQGMDVLVGVVKHELCHFYMHRFHPSASPHGAMFQDLLQSIHGNLQAPSSQLSDFNRFYICTHCRHVYYRYRRINTKKYVCGNCRHKLHEISKDKGIALIMSQQRS